MSLRLRLSLAFSSLLGLLLLVTVATALEFRELASREADPAVQILVVLEELDQVLDGTEDTANTDTVLLAHVARLNTLAATVEQRELVRRVDQAGARWAAGSSGAPTEEARAELGEAVARLREEVSGDVIRATRTAADEANAAALGLGVLAAAVLMFGAWAARAGRVGLSDRLTRVDRAANDVLRGETTRRLGFGGDDELARVATALDHVLDLRDRTESAMQGRNRELRALLVAVLHHYPRPGAVLGIDGEIIVSTLTAPQEDTLRTLAPGIRTAARTLLSRNFLSAAELATEVRINAHERVAIQALALGPRRIVGWLAVFTLESADPEPAA